MRTSRVHAYRPARAAARRTNGAVQSLRLSRVRLLIVLVAVFAIMLRVGIQLVSLTGETVELNGTPVNLRQMARDEVNSRQVLEPTRGVIRDRAGNTLALSIEAPWIVVDPTTISDARAVDLARELGGVLGTPAAELEALLTDRTTRYRVIRRWVDPSTARTILESLAAGELRFSGVFIEYHQRRIYPAGPSAAALLGAVNDEGTGVAGVEAYYDDILRGRAGIITAELDARAQPIGIGQQEVRAANDGIDLELTIDPFIQSLAERELERAVGIQSADGGVVIVLDVQSGAIRAMASLPSFDPNQYQSYPASAYNQNPATSQVYEPGSTFKAILAAIGLQTGRFSVDTQVDDTGELDRYGYRLGNWNRMANGLLTPARMLYYSSNIAALQFAEMIGAESFYEYVDRFGFGRPTGVDIAAEASGIVSSPASPGWSPIVLSTNGYGQGIAVTPLQLVRAMATIANDGVMMRPYLVERRCRGAECVSTQPRAIKQVVAPDVARAVQRMLVESANHYAPVVWSEVTDQGGDTWLVPGYEVAAKTGTSSIPNGRGGYETDGVIGSVAGFAPAEHARYAILVKIDRPRRDPWGVDTAIPVFQAITEQLMRYEHIPPDTALAGPGQIAGELVAAHP
jgi:cell division protein FtsI (penicillin-binding protein 3)